MRHCSGKSYLKFHLLLLVSEDVCREESLALACQSPPDGRPVRSVQQIRFCWSRSSWTSHRRLTWGRSKEEPVPLRSLYCCQGCIMGTLFVSKQPNIHCVQAGAAADTYTSLLLTSANYTEGVLQAINYTDCISHQPAAAAVGTPLTLAQLSGTNGMESWLWSNLSD